MLICPPDAPGRVRRLEVAPAAFLETVEKATWEIRAGTPSSSSEHCDRLRRWLLPDGDPRTPRFLLLSDGLLNGIPLAALTGQACVPPVEVPLLVDTPITAHRPSTGADRRQIISTHQLDAAQRHGVQGGVLESEAVTWENIKSMTGRPHGLLHVAADATHKQGTGWLMLADGPRNATDIASLSLSGKPVVLLSSCRSGSRETHYGIDHALAEGFLRAGAPAVITTRWFVQQQEIRHFEQLIHRAWPFEDITGAVHRACDQLREQGHPARLWAAPIVYHR